ncbi:MAG: hypothetical protein JNK72_26080 [Myxococcales bacterium]|nr:hypothetical protein [Myxococcales bacterium]
MTSQRTHSDARAALTHPLWWASLAVLAVNDHLLKGAGLVPPEITGKLSDFAGLLMAPALAAAVLGASSARRRVLAFAPVVLVFSAINLWPEAARGVEACLALLGVAWRITTDPSDLVALAVLPLTWWLSTRPGGRPTHARVARLGVVLGGLACVATSPPPPGPGVWQTTAFVVNRSDRTVDLRLRYVDGVLDCAALDGQPSRYFTRASFDGLQVTFALAPGRTIPLERGAARAALQGFDGPVDGADGGDVAADPVGCDAVLVSADGMPDTLLFWRELASQSVSATPSAEAAAALRGGVEVRAPDTEALTLTAPRNDVVTEVLPIEPLALSCGVPSRRYQWAGAPADGEATLTAVTDLDDGCLALAWQRARDAGTLFYCAPRASLPVTVGEAFTVQRSGPASAAFVGPRRVTRFFNGTLSELRNETDTALRLNIVPRALAPSQCAGRREPCGAWVLPTALDVLGAAAPVLPGAEAALGGSASRTLYLARFDRVVVGSNRCGGDYRAADYYLDFVVSGDR